MTVEARDVLIDALGGAEMLLPIHFEREADHLLAALSAAGWTLIRTNDATVELLAHNLYDSLGGAMHHEDEPWEDRTDHALDVYRDMARAALAVLRGDPSA